MLFAVIVWTCQLWSVGRTIHVLKTLVLGSVYAWNYLWLRWRTAYLNLRVSQPHLHLLQPHVEKALFSFLCSGIPIAVLMYQSDDHGCFNCCRAVVNEWLTVRLRLFADQYLILFWLWKKMLTTTSCKVNPCVGASKLSENRTRFLLSMDTSWRAFLWRSVTHTENLFRSYPLC